MTEQGRLKNTIFDILDNALREGINSLHIEETHKIFAQAKKEFPRWTSFRALPKIDYDTKEPVDEEARYRKEVLDWFVKYFGGFK